MTGAAERIEALMKIHPKGFDLSLERLIGLLSKLGDPHLKLPPVIHFAGTNGKGSTIAFSRAILEAAGLSVHVDTSPHLVNWHERFRMGRKNVPGALVDDATLSDAIERVAVANDGDPITVFEVLTAVTFVLFSEHDADVCLIEVGLGGRFDSTNVMEEVAVSVITPVSMDHEAFLGDTIAKIAFEKAGIIRRKTPLIVGQQQPEALAVIEQQAAKMLAPVMVFGEHFAGSGENGRMVFHDENSLVDLPLPRLGGHHQIENAAVALAACRTFVATQGIELGEQALSDGLLQAFWPGRMQKLPPGKLPGSQLQENEIWLDGGHNPAAAAAIAAHLATLEEAASKPLVLICGMLNTKDPSGYFNHFASLAQKVVTVPILSSDAGIPAQELAQIAASCGLNATAATSLAGAMEIVGSSTANPCRVLICGSLYLVGDALGQNETPPT